MQQAKTMLTKLSWFISISAINTLYSKKSVLHATLFDSGRPMNKTHNLDNEKELIDACINRDPKAQRYLFEKYGSRMLGICSRYCRNLEDARDAMQEGFVKVFGILDKFNGQSKLETWMTRVMINTAIDHFKRESKFVLYEDAEKVVQDEGEHDVLFIDEQKEISEEQILQVLQELPDGYRIVFNMYAIEGLSHRDIAHSLGISEGTSKSQLARARQHLRDLLIQKRLIERQ